MPSSLDHQPFARSAALCTAVASLAVAGDYFFYGYWYRPVRA